MPLKTRCTGMHCPACHRDNLKHPKVFSLHVTVQLENSDYTLSPAPHPDTSSHSSKHWRLAVIIKNNHNYDQQPFNTLANGVASGQSSLHEVRIRKLPASALLSSIHTCTDPSYSNRAMAEFEMPAPPSTTTHSPQHNV